MENDNKFDNKVPEKKTKVGEAMHRDWEQTKHDFNKNAGQELNQDVGDTVGQATGAKPLPPEGVPTYDKK